MRTFNQRERKIIKKLSKIEINTTSNVRKFLQDNYFTINKNNILIINHIKKEVLLYIPENNYDNQEKKAQAIGELWEFISLLAYLVETRYLYILPIKQKSYIDFLYEGFVNGINSNNRYIYHKENNGSITKIYPDRIQQDNEEITHKAILFNGLYEDICKYILGIVYPTEELKYLVKNNFKNKEDIHFSKQKNLMWIGIIISILTSLGSIWFGSNSSKESTESIRNQTMIIKEFNKEGFRQKNIELNLLNDILKEIKTDSIIGDSLQAIKRSI